MHIHTVGTLFVFLSTPSVWRATGHLLRGRQAQDISIHALRVEGDWLPLLHKLH